MRHLTLAVLLLAALLVVSSTGGLSTTAVDRQVGYDVVPDERAYLGISVVDHTLTPGLHRERTLVALENRFGVRLSDVDVSIRGDGPRSPVLRDYEAPRRLAAGSNGAVTAAIRCDAGNDSAATETWTVSIAASGPEVTTELSRTVRITCERGRSAGAGPSTTATQQGS